MIPWIPFLVPRLRLQNRMPLGVGAWFPSGEDETAVPFPTDLGSHPSNRTSFSTSFKIHGRVYRIYPKSAQRAYGSDEQKPFPPFSLLLPTLSLARTARLGGCHHCFAPRVLPPRVPRPSGGPCPRPSWRVWPHVSRLDYCQVAEPPVWSEASRSDPILTWSLSGKCLTPCGSG